jgi:hypothetical protein
MMESKEAVLERVRRFRERKRNGAGVDKGAVTVTPVRLGVTRPVTVCNACNDKDIQIKILRGKVLMLETELREAQKLIPPKADSPYRGF